MPRPKGRPLPEEHREKILNTAQEVREMRAERIEQADPEDVRAVVAQTIRERIMPTHVYSEIVRLMPIPLPDDEEEEDDGH